MGLKERQREEVAALFGLRPSPPYDPVPKLLGRFKLLVVVAPKEFEDDPVAVGLSLVDEIRAKADEFERLIREGGLREYIEERTQVEPVEQEDQ